VPVKIYAAAAVATACPAVRVGGRGGVGGAVRGNPTRRVTCADDGIPARTL